MKKLFNILSDKQKKVIEMQYFELAKTCNNLVNVKEDFIKNKTLKYNTTCAKCNSNEVVDKIITKLQSKTIRKTSQSKFIFIPPSSYRYEKLYTEEKIINKCNKCNNEWEKKIEPKIYASEIFNENYVYTIFNEKTKEDLKNYYAETLHYVIHKNWNHSISSYLKDDITMRKLRKHYKSIFDNEKKI